MSKTDKENNGFLKWRSLKLRNLAVNIFKYVIYDYMFGCLISLLPIGKPTESSLYKIS